MGIVENVHLDWINLVQINYESDAILMLKYLMISI